MITVSQRFNMIRHVVFLVVLVCSVFADYSGYHVLETSPVTGDALPTLLRLDSRFDVLSTPISGRSLRIMTSPEDVDELRLVLNKLGLQTVTLTTDLGSELQRERDEIEAVRRVEELRDSARAVTFDRYMDLNEIMAYLDELATNYPATVSLSDIGTTYEGRPIRAARISNGPGKRMVVMDGGMHAREWMGHVLTLKVLNELVENPANSGLVDLLDWVIVPVLNPDGYNYTWTEGRMWRKNRKPNNDSICVGTDPNRNFDFHWGEDGDNNYCSQAYHGTHAFSEAESTAIGTILRDSGQAGDIALYMATHTYGPFLMYPWAYTLVLPPNAADLQAAGDLAADAIRAVNGTNYVVGSTANVYFIGFGASMDYAMGVGNVSYSYTWELVAGGNTGFDPPLDQIDPIASEAWEGVKQLALYAAVN